MRTYILLCLIFFSACKSGSTLFSKRSPREAYETGLRNAGLENTAMVSRWINAGSSSLGKPVPISIPYEQLGYFSASEIRAFAVRFSVHRGEMVHVQIKRKPLNGFLIYADLWEGSVAGDERMLAFVDTSSFVLKHNVDRDGQLILRLQPELFGGGEFTLSIVSGPSLGFPVSGKSEISSFWGDPRDAGERRHEGVDIFAARGTPAIAAAPGRIGSVTENTLGGKVVFLRVDGRPISLYYAHLDKQLVEAGQRVERGDTVGLVGNTGNARTTSPHLHFGIYGSNGAIDPVYFVRKNNKKAVPVPSDVEFGKLVVLKSSVEGFGKIYDDGVPAKIIGATGNEMFLAFPDSTAFAVQNKLLGTVGSKLVLLRDSAYLLDSPFPDAARIVSLPAGLKLTSLGGTKDFVFVQTADKQEGWLSRHLIR